VEGGRWRDVGVVGEEGCGESWNEDEVEVRAEGVCLLRGKEK